MDFQKSHKYQTVDEYVRFQQLEHQEKLNKIRHAIKEAVPEALECISYNMPAYKFKGILVYFALAKKHIGFYPTPSGISAFQKELKNYVHGRGSVQFPLDQPLPLDLIAEMAKFRYLEVLSMKG